MQRGIACGMDGSIIKGYPDYRNQVWVMRTETPEETTGAQEVDYFPGCTPMGDAIAHMRGGGGYEFRAREMFSRRLGHMAKCVSTIQNAWRSRGTRRLQAAENGGNEDAESHDSLPELSPEMGGVPSSHQVDAPSSENSAEERNKSNRNASNSIEDASENSRAPINIVMPTVPSGVDTSDQGRAAPTTPAEGTVLKQSPCTVSTDSPPLGLRGRMTKQDIVTALWDHLKVLEHLRDPSFDPYAAPVPTQQNPPVGNTDVADVTHVQSIQRDDRERIVVIRNAVTGNRIVEFTGFKSANTIAEVKGGITDWAKDLGIKRSKGLDISNHMIFSGPNEFNPASELCFMNNHLRLDQLDQDGVITILLYRWWNTKYGERQLEMLQEVALKCDHPSKYKATYAESSGEEVGDHDEDWLRRCKQADKPVPKSKDHHSTPDMMGLKGHLEITTLIMEYVPECWLALKVPNQVPSSPEVAERERRHKVWKIRQAKMDDMRERWEDKKINERSDSEDEDVYAQGRRRAKFVYYHDRLYWEMFISRAKALLKQRERDEGQTNGDYTFRDFGEADAGGHLPRVGPLMTNRISCNPEAIGTCANCHGAYGVKVSNQSTRCNFCNNQLCHRCANDCADEDSAQYTPCRSCRNWAVNTQVDGASHRNERLRNIALWIECNEYDDYMHRPKSFRDKYYEVQDERVWEQSQAGVPDVPDEEPRALRNTDSEAVGVTLERGRLLEEVQAGRRNSLNHLPMPLKWPEEYHHTLRDHEEVSTYDQCKICAGHRLHACTKNPCGKLPNRTDREFSRREHVRDLPEEYPKHLCPVPTTHGLPPTGNR